VIVPTRGRPKLILECVQSILDGEQVPSELVVLDQSTEENRTLAEMGTVRGCTVVYRQSSSRGVSAARNEACNIAGEELLVFTDDDILVAPEWLGAIVRATSEAPDTTLVSGRVLFIDKDATGGFAPSLIDDEQPKAYEGRIWNEVLFSNNMAFSKAIYEHLGPFDERLGVGGTYRSATDNDYCFRSLEAGYRIRYVPEALVYHQAWRSKRSFRQLQWAYGIGQGAYFTKHVHLHDRYTLIRLRNEIWRHAKRALNRGPEADGEAAYVAGLVYGSLRWFVMERLLG
jgi:GT2 family glycosyltransferase